MGQIKPAPQGHLFVAIMSANPELVSEALEKITTRFGAVMGAGALFIFSDFTDYYEAEFGKNLCKQFFVFEEPIDLQAAHRIKIWTNAIEAESADHSTGQPRRRINLDPGYLEPSKLVLFSTKNYAHRIYAGDGIFAEVTLIFEHGRFTLLPWTYPDYASEMNLKFLSRMRSAIVRLNRAR